MKKRRKNRKLKKNNLITFFPLIPIVTIGISSTFQVFIHLVGHTTGLELELKFEIQLD